MQLKVIGKPTKVSVAHCRKALRYFAKRLLSKRLYRSLSIKLTFSPNLLVKGECIWTDSPQLGRAYEINIRHNLGDRQMLLALAHEMVHVMQWSKGLMKDYWRNPDITNWQGKDYQFIENDDYWFSPWEIQAYGLEKGLYEIYKKDLRNDSYRRRFNSSQRRSTYKRT